MKYCTYCGRPLKDHANFCNHCGRECIQQQKGRNQPDERKKPRGNSGVGLRIAAAAAIIICIAAAVYLWSVGKVTLVDNGGGNGTVQPAGTEKDTDTKGEGSGELPPEPSAQPLTTATEPPKADGKLNYPISEKDCYIIFKNFFGWEMESCDKVEVERYGEGDEEMLRFSLMVEMIEGEPLYLWGFFKVYVNTGVCTGGAQGHFDIWPVFQADDYYY